MRMKTRKFLGLLSILALLAVYLPLAMLIGANHFANAGAFWQLTYFLAAGLAWVPPAGWIVRWMLRPDPEQDLRG